MDKVFGWRKVGPALLLWGLLMSALVELLVS